jgi:hypothetical protein
MCNNGAALGAEKDGGVKKGERGDRKQFAANPCQRRFSPLHSDARPVTFLPPPRAGVGGGIQAVQSPCWAPRHLASPTCGVAGEPAAPARCQLTHLRPYSMPRALTWASVVRGEGARGGTYTLLSLRHYMTDVWPAA